jgi:hypothetical protein
MALCFPKTFLLRSVASNRQKFRTPIQHFMVKHVLLFSYFRFRSVPFLISQWRTINFYQKKNKTKKLFKQTFPLRKRPTMPSSIKRTQKRFHFYVVLPNRFSIRWVYPFCLRLDNRRDKSHIFLWNLYFQFCFCIKILWKWEKLRKIPFFLLEPWFDWRLDNFLFIPRRHTNQQTNTESHAQQAKVVLFFVNWYRAEYTVNGNWET